MLQNSFQPNHLKLNATYKISKAMSRAKLLGTTRTAGLYLTQSMDDRVVLLCCPVRAPREVRWERGGHERQRYTFTKHASTPAYTIRFRRHRWSSG
jgi:hypothetical protein